MIDVKYLSYEELKTSASRVLRDSDYRDRFPVEIELIVEQEHEIEIVPIFGLQTAFQVDAFISKDLKTITVEALSEILCQLSAFGRSLFTVFP